MSLFTRRDKARLSNVFSDDYQRALAESFRLAEEAYEAKQNLGIASDGDGGGCGESNHARNSVRWISRDSDPAPVRAEDHGMSLEGTELHGSHPSRSSARPATLICICTRAAPCDRPGCHLKGDES